MRQKRISDYGYRIGHHENGPRNKITDVPGVRDMLIGSHSSVEPGHQILMDYLGIPTYFDFGLRLGEGTGAALLYPIIDAAVRILTEMNTLQGIGMK